MVVKTMTSQIHNSPKHTNVPIKTDHHGVSTLMSQNHEITKLHRCHRITRSQNCTYSNVIVGTTMTLSNNKFRPLMVISPTMSMHQIDCNVIVNVSRLQLQRWLQQLQIHLAPNWSISAQNIRSLKTCLVTAVPGARHSFAQWFCWSWWATEGTQEKPCHCFLHFVCFVLSGVLNRLRVSNLVQHTSQHVQAPSVFSDSRKQVTSDIQRIHDESDRHTNKQAQVCCKNVCLWHFTHF